MSATVAGIHLGLDTHANRPAANAVPVGSIYSCSTHSLFYKTDGSTWATYATLGTGTAAGTPALTLGTTAAAGAASTFVATDATLPIFDATAPTTQAFSDAAAVGAAAFAARRDHKHGMPASPGGGGLSHSYVGKNAIGASLLSLTDKVWAIKKITLAADGLLASIGAYIKDSASGGVVSFGVALWADNSNDVGIQIGGMTSPTLSLLPEGPASTSSQRWYHRAVGMWLTAGDYWIGVAQLDHSGAEAISLAYDTGGSDKSITSGGTWIPDGGFYSRTNTTRDHSIRASVLS
jgi:hypothetical protein